LSAFDPFIYLSEGALQRPVLGLSRNDAEGLKYRQPGLQQYRELPAQNRQVALGSLFMQQFAQENVSVTDEGGLEIYNKQVFFP
jgi:hypothetical protein